MVDVDKLGEYLDNQLERTQLPRSEKEAAAGVWQVLFYRDDKCRGKTGIEVLAEAIEKDTNHSRTRKDLPPVSEEALFPIIYDKISAAITKALKVHNGNSEEITAEEGSVTVARILETYLETEENRARVAGSSGSAQWRRL